MTAYKSVIVPNAKNIMEKPNHNFLARLLLVFSVLLLIIACQTIDSVEQVCTRINISEKCDSAFKLSPNISLLRSTELLSSGDKHIGNVLSLCVLDSFIYVIDATNGISKFGLSDGKMRKQLRKVGKARDEYLQIQSICTDGNNLYVLDLSGMSVLMYDSDLTFKSKIKLKFPSLDFIKTEDGFLFFNLNANDDLKQIVYTDNNGKVKKSFFDSEIRLDAIMPKDIFVKGSDDKIYFSLPMSNEIYCWTGRAPKLIYRECFWDDPEGDIFADNSSELMEKITLSFFFITKSKVLSCYYKNNFPHYNIYDTRSSVSQSGVIDTTAMVPFFPRWQHKNLLLGVSPSYGSASKEGVLNIFRIE